MSTDGPGAARAGLDTNGAAPPIWAIPACLLVAVLFVAPFREFLTDDSYIHFQFVKHLLRGQGYSFNAGEPISGDTSPLWVLLLAAVGRFVPGAATTPGHAYLLPALAWIGKAVGLAALLASVALIPRVARRLGWEGWACAIPAALLAAHAWSARWALSGLETSLAVLLVILALDALAASLLTRRSTLRAGVLLGLLFLTRPEGLVLTALAGAALWFGSERPRAMRLGTFVSGFAIPVVPWLAAAWFWFHRLLPTTGAAKAIGGWDPERVVAAVRDSIRDVLACDAAAVALAVAALALAPGAGLRGAGRGRRAFWLLVAAWPWALVGAFAGGGVQVVSRYLLPAAPSVILLGVAALRWARDGAPRWRRALPAALLLAAVAQNGVLLFGWAAPQARTYAADLQSSLAWLGVWARERTPPGTMFAMPDIGAFAFYSDRPVLDLFGLMTPPMAPIAVREGYDAVVRRMLFEPIARPGYLIDRSRERERLADRTEPESPYRFILAREVRNLGITRPGPYYYSLYAIDWEHFDRTAGPRVARAAEAVGPFRRDLGAVSLYGCGRVKIGPVKRKSKCDVTMDYNHRIN